MFSTLTESRIEGIEPLASRYNLIVSTIKKKGYDFLDHRKVDFEADYDDFKRQLQEVQVRWTMIVVFQRFEEKDEGTKQSPCNCRQQS